MSDQEDFQNVQFGNDHCNPVQAGSIKKGDYCMLREFPCKIIDISVSKPGKHGSAKCVFTGIDIFTNKKHEDTAPTSHNILVPLVYKTEYQVANINEDGFVSLIQENTTLKEDLKLQEDQKQLRSLYDDNCDDKLIYFTIIKACGQQKIVGGRTRDY